MNATVISNESSQAPIKPSFFNEVFFFAKASLVMAAIVLLVASTWV
ncbi:MULTISPECIES: hypothetical protein [Vibrio]|nr:MULTISPECIES: hypothetical protein [Vibrio]USE02515.1 hypothetical protein JKJ11_22915 [Vibrio sp. SCSIO 43133]